MMKKIICVLVILLASGVSALWAQDDPDYGLEANMLAPDFTATTSTGAAIQLSSLYKKSRVVLVFYRGGWCPYCNRHLKALQEYLPRFDKAGAMLLALSVDTPANAAKTVEEFDLGFPVISNPSADVLELYNLVYQVPDELAEMYKEDYNIDLEAASGREDHIIAVPAVFVIDKGGAIIYSYANEDYKIRKSPEEILEVLKDPGTMQTVLKIKEKILEFGPWAFWVYVGLYMLNTMTLVPPILFMTLAGGALFGPLWGSVAIFLGCILGTSMTFYISRFLGRGFIEKHIQGERARRFEARLNEKGFITILIMRLVAFPPWEFVNYAAGLTKIKFRDFIAGTAIGIIPAIVVQVYLADRAINIDFKDPKLIAQLILAAALFILLGQIPAIYKKIKRKSSNPDELPG